MTGLVGGAHLVAGAGAGGQSRGSGEASPGDGGVFAQTVKQVSGSDKDGSHAHGQAKSGEAGGAGSAEEVETGNAANGRAGASEWNAAFEFLFNAATGPGRAATGGVKGEGALEARLRELFRERLDHLKSELVEGGAPQEAGGSKQAEIVPKEAALLARALLQGSVLTPLSSAAATISAGHAGRDGDPAAPLKVAGVMADGRSLSETASASAIAGKAGGDKLFDFARAGGALDAKLLSQVEAAANSALPSDRHARPTISETAARDALASLERLDGKRIENAVDLRTIEKRGVSELAVVESRKYLGVATGQTAVASVVSAVTENAEWNAMLREASATAATTLNAARNVSNSLKIQLSPPELGMVTATLRMSGGHLSIDLKVETIEAYRQLSDDHSNLLRALRGHGYDVDQVVIQQAPGDKGQNLAAASTQQGGQSGAAAGEGGSANAGRERGGEARRDGQQGGDGQRENDSRHPDQHRSGDVYL